MNDLLGGILLIAGTAIGAGMLALPVATGLNGFFPTVITFFICWMVMIFSALFTLEAALFTNTKETNLISMSKLTLGKIGPYICWTTYLFLFYSLLTAYIAGTSSLFIDSISTLANIQHSFFMGSLAMVLILCVINFQGIGFINQINKLFILGLVVSYILLISLSANQVDNTLLSYSNWDNFHYTLPILAASFGYHIVIPSLTSFYNKDVKKIRTVIIIGSTLPLLIYIFWEYIVLGVVPLSGQLSLTSARNEGTSISFILQNILTNNFVKICSQGFAFFAIITSAIGVSLGLTDFLADGLKIKKTSKGKVILCMLAMTPPLLFSKIGPQLFLKALEYAGAYGVTILIILLPSLMVWFGRYKKGYKCKYQVFGGKISVIFTIIMGLIIIFSKIQKDFLTQIIN